MIKLETRRLPEVRCLKCGYKLDAATGDGQPSPGDASICIECLHVAVFADDLSLREPTAEEASEMERDEKLFNYMHALALAKQRAR